MIGGVELKAKDVKNKHITDTGDYMPLIKFEIQPESNNKVSTLIKSFKHFIFEK
jgi:hypothetical protein